MSFLCISANATWRSTVLEYPSSALWFPKLTSCKVPERFLPLLRAFDSFDGTVWS